jgi:hypothetical protein
MILKGLKFLLLTNNLVGDNISNIGKKTKASAIWISTNIS